MQLNRGIALLSMMIFSSSVLADLVFTAPPREDPARGKKIYQPIADMMSRVMGEKVVYQHPKGWDRYARDMRAGKYDIVFDGPHFAAWRIKHLDHQPVVKLPGSLKFVVVSRRDNAKVRHRSSLANATICGLAAPNLATLSVLSEYQGSPQKPTIVEIKGGMKSVYKAFKARRCDAAVLRDGIWNKFVPEADKDQLRIVFSTLSVPNQTITVGPGVKSRQLERLRKAMKAADGSESAQALLMRFSKKAKYFVHSNPREYLNLEKYLEEIVSEWGIH